MPTQTQYQTITAKAARAAGYHALTYSYPPREYLLMDRVIADMKRAPRGVKPIDYAIVVEDDAKPNDLAVWRKNISG